MGYDALSRNRFETAEQPDEQKLAAQESPPGAAPGTDEQLDFFVKRDGLTFAGAHLIVDLWEAGRLDDPDHVETTLVKAAKHAGATVLSTDFHVFSPNNGVSGVVVLAESHISIHTWPERNFAAVDVFMCGDCLPQKTLDVLREGFSPDRINVVEHKRGIIPE